MAFCSAARIVACSSRLAASAEFLSWAAAGSSACCFAAAVHFCTASAAAPFRSSAASGFLDFTLCHCARVFLVLDRLVALGFQLVVSLPLVLGRRRVELGRMAQRITALKNCLNDLRRQELCLTLRCLSASYRE